MGYTKACARCNSLSLSCASLQFTEAHARTFGSTASSSNARDAPSDDWVLVPGQPPFYTFKASGMAEDGTRAFECIVPWIEEAFVPSLQLRFPCVPGLSDALSFVLPSDASIVGKDVKIATRLDVGAAKKKSSVCTTNLMMPRPAPAHVPEGAAGAVAPEAPAPATFRPRRRDPSARPAEDDTMRTRVDTTVRAKETRPPIESCTLPPIHAAHALAQLKEVGEFILARSARDGNCFPASCLASVQNIGIPAIPSALEELPSVFWCRSPPGTI